MRYYAYLFFIMVLTFGCATTPGEKPKRGSRYTITAEEIKQTTARTAYEAIQWLRPNLLNRDIIRSVDLNSAMEVVIYINDIRYGRKETLHDIPTEDILKIQYLSPSEATTRYGTAGGGGIFMITLK